MSNILLLDYFQQVIMTKKILLFIFNSLILTALFVCLTFVNIPTIPKFLKTIILVGANIIYFLSIVFKWLGYQKTSKTIFVLYLTISLGVIVYAILFKLNIITTISSVESLKNYILSLKSKGVYIYILIQAAQVVILPVPAAIICVVGSIIYGPLLGGLYCSISILIGSFISFIIGKTFGYKIVAWIAGKENTDKYSQIIRKRGAFFLAVAFLLPMFPDDILCLIAGITNMKFKTFAIVTAITRPIGVICMSYFGSGYIIPFTGWGIYVWVALLVVVVITVFLTYRYQERMQNFVLNKLFKRRDKHNKQLKSL